MSVFFLFLPHLRNSRCCRSPYIGKQNVRKEFSQFFSLMPKNFTASFPLFYRDLPGCSDTRIPGILAVRYPSTLQDFQTAYTTCPRSVLHPHDGQQRICSFLPGTDLLLTIHLKHPPYTYRDVSAHLHIGDGRSTILAFARFERIFKVTTVYTLI